MAEAKLTILLEILRSNGEEIFAEWLQLQQRDLATRNNLMKQGELEQQCRDFLAVLATALERGGDVSSADFAQVRDFLSGLSRSRARQGFTPTETATFVLSLKQPLFEQLRRRMSDSDGPALAGQTWQVNLLLDKLGLNTIETYMKGREEIIARQQQELLELSTPVVRLWKGVLALPLIGTLDSARTQVVMESLLQAIVDTGSVIAIIDITGVPVVDTLVAQHLLKTVAAARLLGADCIISGIRPQIAQTIVHLGVDIGDVITKATLADAFSLALTRAGLAVRKKVANPAVATLEKGA
ncbi:MAG: anti-sigma-factor antagonist [Acidobacteria bacterium]|nr:anti-sigma-factor antagonist [Acidobacteriota bacterium]